MDNKNIILKDINMYLNMLSDDTKIDCEDTMDFCRVTFFSKSFILTFIKLLNSNQIIYSLNEKVSDSRYKEINIGKFEIKYLGDYFLKFSERYLDLKLIIY